MTIASTNTHEFSINRLVYTAYRRLVLIAPGQELTQIQLTEGTDELELTMRDLDSRGISLRQAKYRRYTLTADSEWLELDEDVFDVGHVAMNISADEANPDQAASEVPAKRVYRDELHTNSAKSATSDTVTMFRLDKEQTPYRLELWPIPSTASSLRVEVHVVAADSTDASKTPDREKHFQDTLVYGMMRGLGRRNGVSLERIQDAKAEYELGVLRCLGQEKDIVDRQFKVGHRSGFRGRRR